MLVASQVILSIILPTVILPLVYLCSQKDLMVVEGPQEEVGPESDTVHAIAGPTTGPTGSSLSANSPGSTLSFHLTPPTPTGSPGHSITHLPHCSADDGTSSHGICSRVTLRSKRHTESRRRRSSSSQKTEIIRQPSLGVHCGICAVRSDRAGQHLCHSRADLGKQLVPERDSSQSWLIASWTDIYRTLEHTCNINVTACMHTLRVSWRVLVDVYARIDCCWLVD